MTENSDPNGYVSDEDLEFIKEVYEEVYEVVYEEDLKYAEDRLEDYPAPKWWIEEAYYDDLD